MTAGATRDDETRSAAEFVLLDPRRRAVYDRNRQVLVTIGQLRSRLGLNLKPFWSRGGFGDFSYAFDPTGGRAGVAAAAAAQPPQDPLADPRMLSRPFGAGRRRAEVRVSARSVAAHPASACGSPRRRCWRDPVCWRCSWRCTGSLTPPVTRAFSPCKVCKTSGSFGNPHFHYSCRHQHGLEARVTFTHNVRPSSAKSRDPRRIPPGRRAGTPTQTGARNDPHAALLPWPPSLGCSSSSPSRPPPPRRRPRRTSRRAPPAAAAPTAQEGSELDRIVPEVTFEDQRLDDIIEFLTDLEPRFKALVIRDPDVPRDYPQVRLRLKRVPLGQILEVLTTAFPDIEVSPVQANNGPQGADARPVYIIKVHASDRAKAASGEVVPGGVKVYRLTNVVGTLAQSAHPRPLRQGTTDRREGGDGPGPLAGEGRAVAGRPGRREPAAGAPGASRDPDADLQGFVRTARRGGGRAGRPRAGGNLATPSRPNCARKLRKSGGSSRRSFGAGAGRGAGRRPAEEAAGGGGAAEGDANLGNGARLAEAERAKVRFEEQQKLLADLNAKLSDLEHRMMPCGDSRASRSSRRDATAVAVAAARNQRKARVGGGWRG